MKQTSNFQVHQGGQVKATSN